MGTWRRYCWNCGNRTELTDQGEVFCSVCAEPLHTQSTEMMIEGFSWAKSSFESQLKATQRSEHPERADYYEKALDLFKKDCAEFVKFLCLALPADKVIELVPFTWKELGLEESEMPEPMDRSSAWGLEDRQPIFCPSCHNRLFEPRVHDPYSCRRCNVYISLAEQSGRDNVLDGRRGLRWELETRIREKQTVPELIPPADWQSFDRFSPEYRLGLFEQEMRILAIALIAYYHQAIPGTSATNAIDLGMHTIPYLLEEISQGIDPITAKFDKINPQEFFELI